MTTVALKEKEYVTAEIKKHTEKVLSMRDHDGMIPSSIRFGRREPIRRRDIPRQSMAVMALSFANSLVPSLRIENEITASLEYVERALEKEPSVNVLFARLYLALGCVYAGKDTAEAVANLLQVLSPKLFSYPIAANLYLRLSRLLPGALPHVAYVAETQRYETSLVPRRHRYFDFADVLLWGKESEPSLAQSEYEYILACKTDGVWFADPKTGTPATSSIAAKFFEVLVSYGDLRLAEALYASLESRKAKSEYARHILGDFSDHILSEPSALQIDDAHSHILVGLCYRYQSL